MEMVEILRHRRETGLRDLNPDNINTLGSQINKIISKSCVKD